MAHVLQDNSPTTLPMCEQCDLDLLRKARHRDHCHEIMGKVIKCKENDAMISSIDLIDVKLKHYFAQHHDIPLDIRGEWIDIACLRYPFDFDDDECTMSINYQQEDTCWMTIKAVRKALVRRRFDMHDILHRETCFKKGDECRSDLPAMPCNESFILDKERAQALLELFQVDDKVATDMIAQFKIVKWHYLDGSVVEKTSYSIVPKRPVGCEYMNQHSEEISEVISSNTNVNIGDPVYTYYCTQYKTKDTQKEDNMSHQRVNNAVGRKILNYKCRQAESNIGKEDTNNTEDTENEENEPDHVAGLGMVLTGLNAATSRATVSSTLAHTLICQKGSRFTYSHDFRNLLLTQMEDVLDDKEVQFVLRRNRNPDTGDTETWADSSAHDYLYRPEELNNICFYEMTMNYDKKHYTFEQMRKNNDHTNVRDEESQKKLVFNELHHGRHYSYLTLIKKKIYQKYPCDMG